MFYRGQTHDHVQTLNLQVKRNEIKFSNRSQRSSQQETIIPESADISLYLPLNLTFLLLNYLIKSLEGSSVLQSHSIPADSQQDGGDLSLSKRLTPEVFLALAASLDPEPRHPPSVPTSRAYQEPSRPRGGLPAWPRMEEGLLLSS